MSLSKTASDLAKTGRSMSAAAAVLLRRLYGERHTAKRVARDRGVSVSTAKSWLAGNIPEGKLDLLYPALARQLEARLAELAEAEAELARLLRLQAEMARRRRGHGR